MSAAISPSPATGSAHDGGTRPIVTVDVVIFSLDLASDDLQVLLVKRTRAPHAGMWALPGGFVQMDESLEDAAARQLQAKAGVTDVYMEQLFTFGEPERDPRTRVITVAYFALVPLRVPVVPAGPEQGEVAWHSVYGLPALAFDHAEIVAYALQRLRYKLEYTTVGFELLPDEFTLSALQRAYEIVLGEGLDKRNFRRKLLSADIVEQTDRRTREGEGRPAQLYRYRAGAVTEVKSRRLFP
jgi:8-oxo-dGTP diphosphatase